MKVDLYVDSVMGDWKHDKKSSNKDNMSFKREAPIKLHKDYAVTWTDPEDFKEYHIWGDVVLTEQKLVDAKTSNQTFFRGVKLTKTTEKKIVIK